MNSDYGGIENKEQVLICLLNIDNSISFPVKVFKYYNQKDGQLQKFDIVDYQL